MDTIYQVPQNTRKLETMYAIVSEDAEGKHGILAEIVSGMVMTFVTLEPHLIEPFIEIAKKASKRTGVKCKLVTLKVESMKDI